MRGFLPLLSFFACARALLNIVVISCFSSCDAQYLVVFTAACAMFTAVTVQPPSCGRSDAQTRTQNGVCAGHCKRQELPLQQGVDIIFLHTYTHIIHTLYTHCILTHTHTYTHIAVLVSHTHTHTICSPCGLHLRKLWKVESSFLTCYSSTTR